MKKTIFVGLVFLLISAYLIVKKQLAFFYFFKLYIFISSGDTNLNSAWQTIRLLTSPLASQIAKPLLKLFIFVSNGLF